MTVYMVFVYLTLNRNDTDLCLFDVLRNSMHLFLSSRVYSCSEGGYPKFLKKMGIGPYSGDIMLLCWYMYMVLYHAM